MLVPKINKLSIPNKYKPMCIKKETNELMKSKFYDMYIGLLSDEIEMNKYIKYIEKIIRGSYEYKQYVFILINEFDISKCKFFKNIGMELDGVNIEFHHYPFTLYDIVNIVINDKLEKLNNDFDKYSREIINPYFIADEVLQLHYKNKIGLVPLTLTVHQLVHNGNIFIPLTDEYVFGNYKSFINSYSLNKSDYVSKMEILEKITKEIVSGEKDLDLDKLNILKTDIIMKEATIPQKIIKKDDIKALA